MVGGVLNALEKDDVIGEWGERGGGGGGGGMWRKI